MSVDLMSKVWKAGPKSQSETMVLLALADHANDKGEAYPSVRALAAKCRYTPSGLHKILKRLRDAGWIAWESGDYETSNRYFLNVRRLKERAATREAEEAAMQEDSERFRAAMSSEPEDDERNENVERDENAKPDNAPDEPDATDPAGDTDEAPAVNGHAAPGAEDDPVKILTDMWGCRLSDLQKEEIRKGVTDLDLWREMVKSFAMEDKTTRRAAGWLYKDYRKKVNQQQSANGYARGRNTGSSGKHETAGAGGESGGDADYLW